MAINRDSLKSLIRSVSERDQFQALVRRLGLIKGLSNKLAPLRKRGPRPSLCNSRELRLSAKKPSLICTPIWRLQPMRRRQKRSQRRSSAYGQIPAATRWPC